MSRTPVPASRQRRPGRDGRVSRVSRVSRVNAAFDLVALVALVFALPPAGFVVAVRRGVRAARARQTALARLCGAFALLSVLTSVGVYAAIRGDHSLSMLCETVAAVAVVGLLLRSLLDRAFRLLRVVAGRAS